MLFKGLEQWSAICCSLARLAGRGLLGPAAACIDQPGPALCQMSPSLTIVILLILYSVLPQVDGGGGLGRDAGADQRGATGPAKHGGRSGAGVGVL